MDGQQTGQCDRILEGVAKSVEALAGLPAVPTLDWCDRAAAAVARLAGSGVAMITIGTITESGELVEHEVTGVAVHHAQPENGRARPLHRDEIGFRGEDGVVGTLRVRAARLRKLGIHLTGDDRNGTIIGSFQALPGNALSGELAALWEGLDAAEPVVALVPLGAESDGRVMIVQLASIDASPVSGADRGLAVVIPGLYRRTVQALGAERAESTRWLTVREQQVLEQLSLGKSVRQIADDLGRSPHTVHDHVKSLHRKLGASSRGELVARALGHTPAVPVAQVPYAEPKPIQASVPPPVSQNGSIEAKPVPDQARTFGEG